MKKALLLFTAYTLSTIAADQEKKLQLRYVDRIAGQLCSRIVNSRVRIYIEDGKSRSTELTEYDGFVSVQVRGPMPFKEITNAVCAKLQKQGELYYSDAFDRIINISNANGGFDFSTIGSGLDDLGSRLFFIVDPSKPYVAPATT